MDCFSFPDFAQILSCLLQTSDNIIIPKNNYNMLTSFTVPKNKSVQLELGTCINISENVTLTIQGQFKAPICKLFYGAGKVLGIKEVYPEWWGAEVGSQFNQWYYFNAAHDCAKASTQSVGGRPIIHGSSGLYMLGNTFGIQPTEDCPVSFKGSGHGSTGTRFAPLSNFQQTVVFNVLGNNLAGKHIVDLKVSDFSIIGLGSGANLTGFRVGTPLLDYKLDGWHRGLIKNVMVNNFLIGIEIVHARQIKFDRVSSWNDFTPNQSTAMLILQVGGFTGDLTFTDCQFVSNMATGCADLRIISNNGRSQGNSGNMIAGIKFITCDFYQANQKLIIYAALGSWIRDIWFESCQFDADSNQDIYIQAGGAGTIIDNINFNNCYIAGGNKSYQPQIYVINSGGGAKVGSIKFSGGSYQLAQGPTISAFGVSGLSIQGISISDNNNHAGAAIQLTGCVRPIVKGNSLHRVTDNYCAYMVEIAADNVYPSVEGNVGAGIFSVKCVNDFTGNIIKVVANNI